MSMIGQEDVCKFIYEVHESKSVPSSVEKTYQQGRLVLHDGTEIPFSSGFKPQEHSTIQEPLLTKMLKLIQDLRKRSPELYDINCELSTLRDVKVVCRHFSRNSIQARALSMSRKPNLLFKEDVERFRYGTLKVVPEYLGEFLSKNQGDYPNFENCIKEKLLFSTDSFGRDIAKHVDSIKDGETIFGEILTVNHSMRIFITKKGSEYKINFFDPNKTNISTKVILSDIKHLKLTDLFSEEDKSKYFPDDFCTGVLAIYDKERIKQFIASEGSEPKDKSYAKSNISEFIENHIILSQDEDNSDKIKHLKSVVYMVLEEGMPQGLVEIIKHINQLQLSSPQIKEQILLAKPPNGHTGLRIALEMGHSETVRAFMEGLKGLDEGRISAPDLQEILLVKKPDGLTGLCRALEREDSETVRAFMEGLKGLGKDKISELDLKEILLAKDSKGCSGLIIASDMGNSEAVEAFTTGLKGLCISEPDLEEILSTSRI